MPLADMTRRMWSAYPVEQMNRLQRQGVDAQIMNIIGQLINAPPSESNVERWETGREWDASDAALRNQLGGRYRWEGEPIMGWQMPNTRSSPFVTERFPDQKRPVVWERPPDAGLMYRNPYDPEQWTEGSQGMTYDLNLMRMASGGRQNPALMAALRRRMGG